MLQECITWPIRYFETFEALWCQKSESTQFPADLGIEMLRLQQSCRKRLNLHSDAMPRRNTSGCPSDLLKDIGKTFLLPPSLGKEKKRSNYAHHGRKELHANNYRMSDTPGNDEFDPIWCLVKIVLWRNIVHCLSIPSASVTIWICHRCVRVRCDLLDWFIIFEEWWVRISFVSRHQIQDSCETNVCIVQRDKPEREMLTDVDI